MNKADHEVLRAVARGLVEAITTPNEVDNNGESPAGITDGLYEIARSIRFLARVVARNECRVTEHDWALAARGEQCRWCGVYK